MHQEVGLGFFVVNGVLSLIGVVTSYAGIKVLRLARAVSNWPSCAGRVIASSVESSHNPGGGRRNTFYQPVVHYSYSIGGTRYEGSRVRRFVAATSSKAKADSVVASLPPGAQVVVWYNPANPRDAVLDRSPSASDYIVLIVGGGCLVVSLLVSASAFLHNR